MKILSKLGKFLFYFVTVFVVYTIAMALSRTTLGDIYIVLGLDLLELLILIAMGVFYGYIYDSENEQP